LTLDETQLFMRVYSKDLRTRFSADAVRTLHYLSGGSPRELLRIACVAFEKTGGNLTEASDDVLLQAASTAGSIADRAALALSLADAVFARFGSDAVRSNLLLDGVTIDRVVSVDRVPTIALMVLRATDKLSEVNIARQTATARGALAREWPGCELIVVPVGYSSKEVQELELRNIGFEEHTFQGLLETEVTRIAATTAQSLSIGRITVNTLPSQSEPELRDLLQRVSERLDQLQTERSAEYARVDQRLAAGTAELAAPARQEQELKTRWDMVGALDRLEEDIREDRFGSTGELLGRMRAILVANETSRSDPVIDQLGGAFLDLVSLRADQEVLVDLLFDMRQALRTQGGWQATLRRFSPLGEIGIGLVAAALVWAPASTIVFPLIALGIALMAGILVAAGMWWEVTRTNPTRRWSHRVARMRSDRGTYLNAG
jgi:hypothetical protein